MALPISGTDKRRFGRLTDEHANNYLVGTDQYPNTYEKELRILGNYQSTKNGMPYHASPSSRGVAFLQRGGGQGGRAGRGGQVKGPAKKDESVGRDASNKVSTMMGQSNKGLRINSKGESYCFHCGTADHWAYECPGLSGEQQDQLHMTLQGEREGEDAGQEEGHQLLNVALMQGGALPDNQAYLDGCSTVMAFKSRKYLKGVKTLAHGIRINCNARAVRTNCKGMFRRLQVRYLPKGIANIFSVHKLEKTNHITYDSWDGYCAVHMPRREVLFIKTSKGYPTSTWKGLIKTRQ